MKRLCRVCNDWHSLDDPWPPTCAGHFRSNNARSDLGFPQVISDQLHDMQSMVDGRVYTSKAALRASYARAGVMEVGNEIDATMKLAAEKPARPKVTKGEIAAAVQKVKQGYRPHLPAD